MTRSLISFVLVSVLMAASGSVSPVVAEEDGGLCRPPGWVTSPPPSGRIVHAVATVPAGEDELLSRQRALVLGIRRLLLELNEAENRLLELARMFGGGLPPGVSSTSSPAESSYVVDSSEKVLLNLFSQANGISKECWSDPCGQKVWCHTEAPRAEALKAADLLLEKADLNRLFESVLRQLYSQAGPDYNKVVFHQIRDGQLVGEMGACIQRELERVATGRKVFSVAGKADLDRLLNKLEVDVASISKLKPSGAEEVRRLTDGIVVGSYHGDGRTVTLELSLLSTGGRRVGAISTAFFVTALPVACRSTPAIEEAARRDLELIEKEAGLKEEQEKLKWEQERWGTREAELREEVRNAELGRIREEVREEVRGDLEASYASRVEREVAALEARMESQGAAQLGALREEVERKLLVEVEAEFAPRVQAAEKEKVDAQVSAGLKEEYANWKSGGTADSPLEVAAWLDKGCGATYHVGESAVISVRCSRDCFVKVFHLSAEGELQMVFPNQWDRDNALASGKVHTIGDSTYHFEYEIVEPQGAELVTVVASETQFGDLDAVATEVKAGGGVAGYGRVVAKDLPTTLYRGMRVKKRRTEIPAAATVSRATCALLVEAAR